MGKRYDFVEEGKKDERIYSKIGLVSCIVGFIGFIGGMSVFICFDLFSIWAAILWAVGIPAMTVGFLCFSEHRTKGMAIGAVVCSVAIIVLGIITIMNTL